MNRPPLPIIAAIGIALLLGGCSAPAGLAAFQRSATAGDQLPAGADTPDSPKMDNTRLLAEPTASGTSPPRPKVPL
jgi:PBP1b-binding outer membrane lipoprotein LpoB